MINRIDQFLNAITMYRLVLYGLGILALTAILLGFFGVLPYHGVHMLGSAVLLVALCFFANILIARLYRITANTESSLITGLILFLILTPAARISEAGLLALGALIAMGSKYLLSFHGRHIFNPAAFAAVVLGLMGSPIVAWWVGSTVLLAVVLIIGLAVVRKVRRFEMFGVFFAASIAVMMVYAVRTQTMITDALVQSVTSWPLLFFGTIMLTEPLTTPPTRYLRIRYGLLVGVLFSAQFRIGPLFSTPEFALIAGNVFSFLVSMKRRVGLRLLERTKLAPGLYEFAFAPSPRVPFQPGQYLEWTLPHTHPDRRGIRRYFTIASSPTEEEIKLGVRIGANPSSFKKALVNLAPGATLSACHLAGDFTLPRNAQRKLLCIAGGIGVTPFRSMVQYLIDKGEKRDMILLYACASAIDFAYMDIFEKAREATGLRCIPIVTDPVPVGQDWKGRQGRIDEAILKEEAPDWQERLFYLSGPSRMVDMYKKLLRGMGVRRRNIVTDYFPGF